MMHDYNNPQHAAQQVLFHLYLFKEKMLSQRARTVYKLVGVLTALSIAIPGTQALVRRTVAAEGSIRPILQTILYALATGGTLAITPLIQDRKQAEIGWKNLQKSELESYEDIVTNQAERKFYPFANDRDVMVLRELNSQPKEELTSVQEPIVLPEKDDAPPYQAPPVLEKTDLSSSIANTTLPVMVIGSTGTGKTTLLMNVVGQILERGEEVWVFDGKPKRGSFDKFGSRINYIPLGQVDEVPHFVAKLKECTNIMQDPERDENSPRIWIILDEINNAITKAEVYMVESGSKGKEDKLIGMYNNLLLSQGRQKNVPTIGTSHEANASTIGGSTGMRTNYRFAILGSPKGTENIEHILAGMIKLIPSENERTLLRTRYEAMKPDLVQRYYALSNTTGEWRFMS